MKQKHQVGDTVWHVSTLWQHVDCPTCGGNSRIVVEGVDYLCAKCKGSNKVCRPSPVYIVEQLTIICAYTDDHEVSYEATSEKDRYHGREFFTSEEEARIECNKLNNKS